MKNKISMSEFLKREYELLNIRLSYDVIFNISKFLKIKKYYTDISKNYCIYNDDFTRIVIYNIEANVIFAESELSLHKSYYRQIELKQTREKTQLKWNTRKEKRKLQELYKNENLIRCSKKRRI